MDRAEVVLAAWSAGGRGSRFNPIQFQSLIFLIDREVADHIGGPRFDFEPYIAGPFAPAVFDVAESLAADGDAIIDRTGPYWAFSVSEAGFSRGQAALSRMPRHASRYVAKASGWVLTQPFGAMVSAIFRQYPDMAVNSGIAQYALRDSGWATQRRMHPFLAGMASLVGVFHGRRRLPEGAAPGRDAIAIESDWRAVGDDLRFAIEQANPARTP